MPANSKGDHTLEESVCTCENRLLLNVMVRALLENQAAFHESNKLLNSGGGVGYWIDGIVKDWFLVLFEGAADSETTPQTCNRF